MFELIKTEKLARRGVLHTVHGDIETPFFMNVGTAAAIKGAVSSIDLRGIKTQVELCNTYHLHLRPGEDVVYKMGGLQKFMNWDKPVLTDSDFRYFLLPSCVKLRKRECISLRISTADGFSSVPRRVCKFSQSSLRLSRWHSMSA